MGGTSVVIVGGGFGGLSTACYLADAGFEVTLLEKNDRLGGLASVTTEAGFRFDTGPTWYMMPEVFGRFFADFGRSPADYYWLKRLDPGYRVYFRGNGPGATRRGPADSMDVSADPATLRERFEDREPGAGEALDEYLAAARRTYEASMESFVYTDRPRFRDWVGRDVLAAGPVGLQLYGNLEDYVARFFEDPKLRQVVQYAAVFLGGSPASTPRLYHMMSHVDLTQGVYYPEGGIGGVVDAVADLARELGVTVETGSEVAEITRGRDRFFVVADDRTWRPDAVVSDADYAHTELDLLPDHERQYDRSYWEKRDYGPSAFVLLLGVDRELPELAHHNVVMPVEWDEHFRAVHEEYRWPTDPLYYVCNAARTDPSVAPDGGSALCVSMAVPSGTAADSERRQQYREKLLADLADTTGVDVGDDVVYERSLAVSDFAERYNAYGGTLGLAQSLRQTGPFRPPHRSRAVEGLYFTGSSTNPGVGVPICLISGEHAAACVRADFE